MPVHRHELKHLLRHELVLGQPLPGNVYDDAGRLLVPAGRVLKQGDLDLLSMAMLHVGPDWAGPAPQGVTESAAISPPTDLASRSAASVSNKQAAANAAPPAVPKTTAKPRDVVGELSRQHRNENGTPDKNKRAHARHGWQVVLTLTIEELSNGEHRRRQIEATTFDIAVAGFGFIFNQFIHPGTIVYARFDSLPNKPWLRGVVRNCFKLGGFQHRVGVQFLEVCNEQAGKVAENAPVATNNAGRR
ncbi:MAG: hypothetical protein IT440_11110 [Phycisphaeraceae bacterium]|nr:hypothetical protein [Phycisphaeraceae bacterium]